MLNGARRQALPCTGFRPLGRRGLLRAAGRRRRAVMASDEWETALLDWDATCAEADATAKLAKRPREPASSSDTRAGRPGRRGLNDKPDGRGMATAAGSPKAVPIPKWPADLRPAAAATAGLATVKLLSLNLAGLRGLLNNPERAAGLQTLLAAEDPDVVMFQEHKLQESHIDEHRELLKGWLPGFNQYWAASTARKGYSGTATLVRAGLEPVAGGGLVEDGFGGGSGTSRPPELEEVAHVAGEMEGRLISVELQDFVVVNA